MRIPARAAFVAALAVMGVLLWLRLRQDAPDRTAFVNIPAQGPITLALAGDVLLLHPLSAPDAGGLLARVRGATIGVANLEANLLAGPTARGIAEPTDPRWPFAPAREAVALRTLGFDAVSLANNHAADYGPAGLADTAAALDRAGVLHAGTGADLEAARTAAFAGHGPRGFALVSLSTSSSEPSRATLTRGEIKGRPGLNPLRYDAEITADPQTFSSLKSTVEMLQAGAATDEALSLFGTTIRRGEATSVSFTVDDQDVRDILDVVGAARASAGLVVVSIHSHEPANASATPAAFVRQFAHRAIDAGATLVVGHGPHRLRGIERYGGGAIFYSLGNFIYQASDLDPHAADPFDAGTDLFAQAMGMVGGTAGMLSGLHDDSWWEGLLAVATVEDGTLTDIELYPADLGVDLPLASRGAPRQAHGERAAAILAEIARLSAPYGTRIAVEGGAGTIVADGEKAGTK